ncbi:uncharacterized protein LOC132192852 isoform X2 [Neocloeon triangulifer]|uniref:uncharacterized protein LOC132192852 isoform X2 n=1 Tax=Neocloeon triangulifer TaxID=2078957 RepID=UPI00286EEAE5|nr:uncharacterized protein LOC132192852 isoform X2 [Neocloeon triangulifer]
MALESVESNYIPADDGLIKAGKNDSDEEDLEDGEIADEEEAEEGAIEGPDDVAEQIPKKSQTSNQTHPDQQNSPVKRGRSAQPEFDRRSPIGRHEHQKRRRKRPEKVRNRKKRQHEAPPEQHHDRFSQGPSERKHSPRFGREDDAGFGSDEESFQARKKKRLEPAEFQRGHQRPSTEKRDKLAQQHNKRFPEHRRKPCMFYLQGKCHKGELCTFSHSGTPEHKNELCKFYLMDCCAKKEKCLYMHSEFPCKFFHTGMKCYSKENCKFSHDPLTERTREILLKHIETAPKEILGEFPQLPRNEIGEVVLPTAIPPPDTDGSIPSLFDIKIYTVDKNEIIDNAQQSGSSLQNVDNWPNQSQEDFDIQLQQRLEAQRLEREQREKDAPPTFNFYRDTIESGSEKKRNRSPRKSVRDDSDEEHGLVIMDEREDDNNSQRESGNEDVAVPSNLPKRQRELFLRIQHQEQQREADAAANSDEKDEDEKSEDEEGSARAENWYSSDDEAEEQSLTNVLKNLDKSDASKVNTKTADAPYDLSGINLNDDLTKLLSSLKPKESTNRDPRARDPRARQEAPKPQAASSKDVDLRIPLQKSEPRMPVSCDTDLRQTLFGDTDLRDMLDPKSMPFKPPPLHPPCEEIECSITLNPNIKYVLKTLPVEKIDYSTLRLNFSNPSLRQDPRLQKVIADYDSNTASPMSPPSASAEPRNDPRQRVLASDPRSMARSLQPQAMQVQQQPPMMQQQPPLMDNLAYMMQMSVANGQGIMGSGPPMNVMQGMIPPGMSNTQHNFQPNPQHHNNSRGRGGKGWGRGRGRGRGFRNNRGGWGKFPRDRDDRGSPSDRTHEYSRDSDN